MVPEMSTAAGFFKRGDFILWQVGLVLAGGLSESFLRITYADRPAVHLAMVQRYPRVTSAVFSNRNTLPVIIQAEHVKKSVAFQRDGHIYRLLLPSVM